LRQRSDLERGGKAKEREGEEHERDLNPQKNSKSVPIGVARNVRLYRRSKTYYVFPSITTQARNHSSCGYRYPYIPKNFLTGFITTS